MNNVSFLARNWQPSTWRMVLANCDFTEWIVAPSRRNLPNFSNYPRITEKSHRMWIYQSDNGHGWWLNWLWSFPVRKSRRFRSWSNKSTRRAQNATKSWATCNFLLFTRRRESEITLCTGGSPKSTIVLQGMGKTLGVKNCSCYLHIIRPWLYVTENYHSLLYDALRVLTSIRVERGTWTGSHTSIHVNHSELLFWSV